MRRTRQGWWRGGHVGISPHRRIGLAIAILSWVAIAGLTLYPAPDQAATAADTSIWCLLCGDLGAVDVFLNILLFLPLGVGLGLWRPGWRRAVVLIGLTTLTVEVLQLSFIPGRDASLSDLITNVAGGLAGYLTAGSLRRIIFPSPATCFLLAVLGAGAWLVQQAFASWALQTSFPASVYFGQWAPVLGQFDHFTGPVQSVEMNDVPVPGWRLPNSAEIRDMLEQPVRITVQAGSGERTRRTAPVFSIFDDRQRMIALVGVRGDAVVFHLRTRLDGLRLRSPVFALPEVRPPVIGTPMTIVAAHAPESYLLSVEHPGGSASRMFRVSPSWGWSFILPFNYVFGPEAAWLTAVYVGLWWMVIGYWAGRARGRGAALWWGLTLLSLVMGLAGVPLQFGFLVSQAGEWAGGLIGFGVGWLLGSWSTPALTGSEAPVGLVIS